MPAPTALKTPKTARGRKTLRKLLDAAAQEFGGRGFHDASVAGITARAGIAQGTFYIYFESKEHIFRELVLDLGHQLRQHLTTRTFGAANRLELERMGLAAFIDFVRSDRNLYRIVTESQFVDEAVCRQYFTGFASAYAANLQKAADQGDIRPGVYVERAWALMGISMLLGLQYGIWDTATPTAQIVDRVMDMLESGIKA